MAQLWCTGPCELFIAGSTQSPGNASYLGTCEEKPDAEIEDVWVPVNNDLGGMVPIDRCRQGEQGRVVADLTRWNEPTYAALAHPQPINALAGVNAAARGTYLPGDVGQLAFTEGQSLALFLQFPYSAKGFYAGMPAGYRFANVTVDKESLISLGTKPRKIRLIFECLPLLNMTVSSSLGVGSLLLYDFNVAGLPLPN